MPRYRVFSREDFGLRLRASREKRGWTQKQLESVSGVSHLQIARYEKAFSLPRLDLFAILCEALRTSPSWILFGSQAATRGE